MGTRGGDEAEGLKQGGKRRAGSAVLGADGKGVGDGQSPGAICTPDTDGGVIDVGGFGGDAVKFDDAEVLGLLEIIIRLVADIEATEIKAGCGAGDGVDGREKLRCDEIRAILKHGALAVITSDAEGDGLALGGDVMKLGCVPRCEAMELKTKARMMSDELGEGGDAITGDTRKDFAGDGEDVAGGLRGATEVEDSDFAGAWVIVLYQHRLGDGGEELSEVLRGADEADAGAAAAAIGLADEGEGPPVLGNLLLDNLGD